MQLDDVLVLSLDCQHEDLPMFAIEEEPDILVVWSRDNMADMNSLEVSTEVLEAHKEDTVIQGLNLVGTQQPLLGVAGGNFQPKCTIVL